MKCPHCSEDVGLFSKAMSELGKTKVCPHCGKSLTFGIRHGRFALVFFSIALISVIFGVSGVVAAGIAAGVAAVFSVGLKNAQVYSPELTPVDPRPPKVWIKGLFIVLAIAGFCFFAFVATVVFTMACCSR
ncbi:hypothetical protein [Collimonas sp. PA-H2]|uniref:hypothetical protein n=1 Tax=Collimonas sp. PA-H2 TaxID=1881062 RepID=UPI000BF983B8|nr:hypothetical protein [Collimonas sp. PA-H2]